MWTVKLPGTDDTGTQLDIALTNANGIPVYALNGVERAAIHALYLAYDANLGEPDPCLKPAVLVNCAAALLNAYDQVQKGKRLESLREMLLGAVMECPLCGAAAATTLDHHLPKSEYQALAIYPRNLIPSCQPCNRAKGTLVPVAGQEMIHAYFQTLPTVTFFRADSVYAEGSLKIAFAIEDGALEAGLEARLAFQLDRLKLTERNQDAINLFLFALKPSFQLFEGQPGERDLIQSFLLKAAETYDKDLGLNHWKSAVVRSLASNDEFLDNPWAYLAKPPPAMAAG
jgi:5-methylcytosine-specific restriction endonuclease McrA